MFGWQKFNPSALCSKLRPVCETPWRLHPTWQPLPTLHCVEMPKLNTDVSANRTQMSLQKDPVGLRLRDVYNQMFNASQKVIESAQAFLIASNGGVM